MREYEVVYIFRPELEPEDVDGRLDAFHDRLDGEITAREHWGQRELAFEIEDERRGYYAVAQFRAEPASLDEFEQALDLDEDLLRHLLVVSEGELPVPPSQRREEEGEEESEDEEDEEDEDEGDEDAGDDEAEEGASPEEDEEDDEDEDAGAADAGDGDEPGDEDDESADESDDEEER